MAGKIVIKGAREHNLKDINLEIPRERLVVITGVSGSGKSSLAFDTLYAEGQRRYVESLSAYARQFLEQMERPDVDSIEGLSPSISIEQKSAGQNPRSTVGTVTEIYDHLRLLFARIGRPHCHRCGREISAQTVQQIADQILSLPPQTRIHILAPIVSGRRGEYRRELKALAQAGFARVKVDGRLCELEGEIALRKNLAHHIDLVVDRLVLREGMEKRLADSLEVASRYGNGVVKVERFRDAGSAKAKRSSSARDLPVLYAAFPFLKSLRVCSPSTVLMAPAPPAEAWAAMEAPWRFVPAWSAKEHVSEEKAFR